VLLCFQWPHRQMR